MTPNLPTKPSLTGIQPVIANQSPVTNNAKLQSSPVNSQSSPLQHYHGANLARLRKSADGAAANYFASAPAAASASRWRPAKSSRQGPCNHQAYSSWLVVLESANVPRAIRMKSIAPFKSSA